MIPPPAQGFERGFLLFKGFLAVHPLYKKRLSNPKDTCAFEFKEKAKHIIDVCQKEKIEVRCGTSFIRFWSYCRCQCIREK
jgi:hypothetical protein